MNDQKICPCPGPQHPRVPFNPAGLAALDYRAGDFVSFRHALLQPIPGEVALSAWRPGADGDLAVQVIEWSAYLADIITFYNERIVQQHYLRTADLPESVRRLVRIVGYRPRPGIGATGLIAARVAGPRPVVVPQGFPIQSKPAPGQLPQIFEVDQETRIAAPDRVSADPAPRQDFRTTLLLKGEISGISIGEKLLLVNRNWANQTTDFFAWVSIVNVTTVKSPRGQADTQVEFSAQNPPPTLKATDMRLLRPSQSIGVWAFPAATVIAEKQIDLASLARPLHADDLVLLQAGDTRKLLKLSSVTEIVWFANPADPAHPETSPDPADAIPIPIPHTRINFTPAVNTSLNAQRNTVRLFYHWRDVGQVVPRPATSVSGATLSLVTAGPVPFPNLKTGQTLLVEDAQQQGAVCAATSTGNAGGISLKSTGNSSATLTAPLHVFFNLLPVSRGKSVPLEVLGSGDAARSGQEFVLKKSPLTYLPATRADSTASYRSTLRVYVDSIEWTEVPSFYQQPPDARVFVTYEDEENKTHVLFGDGVNASRLPAGVSNVVASYRFESGAAAPEPGKLTVLTRQLPGLRSVVSPVSPAGGADPESPDELRQLAPLSVLTLDRAVSAADYEAIAARTPGVARARAYFTFDAESQRSLVHVYVGDAPPAVEAARKALLRAMDPSRTLRISPARIVAVRLSLRLRLQEGVLPDPVIEAVRFQLVDPQEGLFGAKRLQIGQSLFRSQLFQACHQVAGVSEVTSLGFEVQRPDIPGAPFVPVSGERYQSGEGVFLALDPQQLTIRVEASRA